MPAPLQRQGRKIVRADLWTKPAATRRGWEWKVGRALGETNPLTTDEGHRSAQRPGGPTHGKVVYGPNGEQIGVPIDWVVDHFTVDHPISEGRWQLTPLIPKLLRYPYRVGGPDASGNWLYSTILSVGERGRPHADRVFASFVHEYGQERSWGSSFSLGQNRLQRAMEPKFPEAWRLPDITGRRNPAPTPRAAGVKRPGRTSALHPQHSRSGAPGASPPARRALAAGVAIVAIAAIVALAAPRAPTRGGNVGAA
jgi:hypothetical protein